ncbi:unnamed protein product [Urochloa humidicola]
MVGEDGETATKKNKRKALEAAETAGPSKRTKKAPKLKKNPKKKKTPLKKKQKKDASAPPPRVARSLKDIFSGSM